LWLVLIYYEKKILLADWWLVLEWCERKTLLDWMLLELPNRVNANKTSST